MKKFVTKETFDQVYETAKPVGYSDNIWAIDGPVESAIYPMGEVCKTTRVFPDLDKSVKVRILFIGTKYGIVSVREVLSLFKELEYYLHAPAPVWELIKSVKGPIINNGVDPTTSVPEDSTRITDTAFGFIFGTRGMSNIHDRLTSEATGG